MPRLTLVIPTLHLNIATQTYHCCVEIEFESPISEDPVRLWVRAQRLHELAHLRDSLVRRDARMNVNVLQRWENGNRELVMYSNERHKSLPKHTHFNVKPTRHAQISHVTIMILTTHWWPWRHSLTLTPHILTDLHHTEVVPHSIGQPGHIAELRY